ncbi:hypothetical protein BJ742DRAFT_541575 [Cladochytrium replicatum]|nr:hypothetical protein BJ742DRAFT_541575 [Cladochytrium replicatum]
MVVLAASICTKTGKAIVSRQFFEMPRSRIEGLLASFPKLIGSSDQHTFVETESVRYVYQPLEELFMVLVTNKQSNILQDIDTLHLFARVVSEQCRTMDEKEVAKNAFNLLSVFDELVAVGGYRESVTLAQIRTITEMESHEERVQAEIAKQKERDAKEELNRKAKMLDQQKREMQKKGGYGGGMSSFSGISSSISAFGGGGASGGSGGGYGGRQTPSYESSSSYDDYRSSPTPAKSSAASGPPSKGMQLGAKKSTANALFESLKNEEGLHDVVEPPRASPHMVSAVAPITSPTTGEAVQLDIEERIIMNANRDGGLSKLEVKGTLSLKVSDPSKGVIRIVLKNNHESNVQFQTHPNVDKALFSEENTIGNKDKSRPFPPQSIVILRWRYSSKDDSAIPLAINCWPSPTGSGSCDVNIEYELQNASLELRDVVISIPYPGGVPPSIGDAEGSYRVDKQKRSIEWEIPFIDASNRSGVLEFSVPSEDVSGFYPISAKFHSVKTLTKVEVDRVVSVADGSSVAFAKNGGFEVEEYLVV